ncbi:MAG TPA: GNAT family N-acetyltransferase [Jatrophihabitans sp.]|nr:GNAT family N-acetyltransferase [Jatrophihabitans sp.]
MLTIARLTEDGWRAAREVRLRALALDPSAFGSTHEREQAYGEDDWRARLASGSWFVAQGEDGSPVGLATLRRRDGEHADYEVNSMWVQPELRGQRIGEALLDAVLAEARSLGARAVLLWVTIGNDAATQLYLRRGFVPTGHTEPLRSDPRLSVAEYLLAVV